MVKNSLYLVALIFFVLIAVAGFFNNFSIETIFLRGSVFALFILLWGVVVVIVSAVIKSEVEAKIVIEEEEENRKEYSTNLDDEQEKNETQI
ncbi:MAG: hypothetical protein ACLFSQ_06155 [Candidatus Zixiibacteriota bacterium]